MTIATPETTVSQITVEDADALATLPLGVTLIEADQYTFTKTGDGLWAVESPDGFTYEDWNDWDMEFPAIIQNPEVLFTPLALLNDVKRGDRVRVVTSRFDGGQHFLKTGTVNDTNVYVEVHLDQDDFSLLFEPGELERVTDETPEDPFAVGKLLQVTKTIGGHGFRVGDVVRVLGTDGYYLLATTTDLQPEDLEGRSPYPGSTFDGRESVWELGVTAWVDRENSEPYVAPAIEEPRTLQIGDRVRIALSYSLPDFRGLTARVIGLGDWGPGDVHIEPETNRPDGFERSPFHITSYNLEVIAEESKPEALDVYVAPLGTAIVETMTEAEVIRNPFELYSLPIGTLVQSTDGLYLAVKGVKDTWLNPAADDANAFIWTALTGLAAATVGVEVLYQPVAA